MVKDLDLDEAYANSKLANLLFSYELARRYKDKNVVSVAVYPGMDLIDRIVEFFRAHATYIIPCTLLYFLYF